MGASGNIEQLDRMADHVCELGQCWDHGLSEIGVSFRDKYLRGILKFGVRKTFGHEANYGFTVSCVHEHSARVGGENEVFEVSLPADSEPRGLVIDAQQPEMLSANVKLMESPEKTISSVVRVARFYDLSRCCGNTLYKFRPLKIPELPRLLASGDREIDPIQVSYAVALRDSDGENVQRSPHGIQVSADFGIEGQRERLFFERHNNIMRLLLFRVATDYADVTISPSLQPLLEGWEIGYGPI